MLMILIRTTINTITITVNNKAAPYRGRLAFNKSPVVRVIVPSTVSSNCPTFNVRLTVLFPVSFQALVSSPLYNISAWSLLKSLLYKLISLERTIGAVTSLVGPKNLNNL